MVFCAFKTRVAAPIVMLVAAMFAAWTPPAFAEVQKLVYEVRHPTYPSARKAGGWHRGKARVRHLRQRCQAREQGAEGGESLPL